MKKNKGSGLLIMAILASVITALIGISLAKVHNLSGPMSRFSTS